MDAVDRFQKKARFLKNLLLLILVGFVGVYTFLPVALLLNLPPYGEHTEFEITYVENESGDKIRMRIQPDTLFYAETDGIIFKPEHSLPQSGRTAMIGLCIAHLAINLPIAMGLLLAYQLFKHLAEDSSPFIDASYKKLHMIGVIVILYALTSKILYSIIGSLVVGGQPVIVNPFNFTLVVLGLVIFVFSEILEYGVSLQAFVDETL